MRVTLRAASRRERPLRDRSALFAIFARRKCILRASRHRKYRVQALGVTVTCLADRIECDQPRFLDRPFVPDSRPPAPYCDPFLSQGDRTEIDRAIHGNARIQRIDVADRRSELIKVND